MPPVIIPRSKPDLRGRPSQRGPPGEPASDIGAPRISFQIPPRSLAALLGLGILFPPIPRYAAPEPRPSWPERPSFRASLGLGILFRRSLATLLRNLGLPGRNDRASGLRSVSAHVRRGAAARRGRKKNRPQPGGGRRRGPLTRGSGRLSGAGGTPDGPQTKH